MSTAGQVDLPIEVFSGYVPEIAPSDLPEGASPACQDVQFPLGSWLTRPGLGSGVFAALAGNPTINYQKTYVDQSRNMRFLFLDSSGSMNQEFPQNTVTTGINGIPIPAGSYGKSATAYGTEYLAVSDGQFGVSDPAQWNGTFYDRLSQVGPGAPPSVVDSGVAGNIPAGLHQLTVFFITRSGYYTKPAPPVSWTAAGSFKAAVTNIPIGPPNVVARVLMFTTAAGAVFFFTTNASNTLANGNMVINDNTTTTLTVDFSDTILAAGSSGQYLFSLLELEECAGVVSYATRLFTWGGRNLVPNFINLPFDGGFGGASTSTNQGPNAPSVFADRADLGGLSAWVNIGNVVALDGVVATNAIPASSLADALQVTGFGFTVPDGATITGIVAKAYVKGVGVVTDYEVFLVKAGVLVGSNHANHLAWGAAIAPQTYGTSLDLWASTWTPADIRDPNFGFLLAPAAGFGAPATASIDFMSLQVFYTTPSGGGPLGWTQTANYAGGSSSLSINIPAAFGDAFAITGDGVTAIRGQITQSAAIDFRGNPVLKPNVSYTVRARVKLANGLAAGTFRINLQSTSAAFTTSGLALTPSQLTASYQVFTASLTSALGVIPADLLLQVYADGTPTNNGNFIVDSIQIFQTNQPYLNTTMRASLAGQPESFMSDTGVLQPFFQDGGTIRTSFVLREALYILKDNAWYRTQDDGANEPSAWKIEQVSGAVGACGINAADVGEDWAIVINRAGPYLFWGGEPVKIGQEIFSDTSESGKVTWSSINWQAGFNSWIVLDKSRKRALIGVPVNGATTPNIIFYLDYVGTDSVEQVADHWSVRYSSYTGKILAIGNAPKWAPWNIVSNSAALIERADGTAHTFIGNGAAAPLIAGLPANTGKIYDLLDANKNDDGQGIPWSYSTYFAPGHIEEQALQIKAHRKLFGYLCAFVKGSGLMSISLQPMGNITPDTLQGYHLVDPSDSRAITAISRVNGVTTVTCAGGHGLTAGVDNQVVIVNSADASFNGTVPIQQVLNATQFTFSQYLLPDLLLGAGGTATRLSRELEYTTNTHGERASYTFANSGNLPNCWAQMEKLIPSITPDPWAPVRGGTY